MIKLTKNAINKITEFAADENLPLSIRIKILGQSCSGLGFEIEFDENITDLDEKIEQDGITVIVDQLSMCYIDDVVIDYVEGVFGNGFKFSGGIKYKSCRCESGIGFL